MHWNIHLFMDFFLIICTFFPSFKLNLEKERDICGENKETLEHFMLNLSQINKRVKRFAWLSFNKRHTNKKSKSEKEQNKRRFELKKNKSQRCWFLF